MPGFLMHLVEGEMLLKKIGRGTRPYKTAEQQFLLGCVLPDITTDKEKTHFRPQNQVHRIDKYPDMAYVWSRCKAAELSPIDFGILAHLQLDADYVTKFWPQYFEIQTQDGTPSTDLRDELFVRLFRQPESVIPLWDFFSLAYFYGDYDIVNPVLIQEFHPFIPTDVPYSEHEIYIKECIPESSSMINSMLGKYAAADSRHTPCRVSDLLTKVFPYPDMIAFLKREAEAFADQMQTSRQSFLI